MVAAGRDRGGLGLGGRLSLLLRLVVRQSLLELQRPRLDLGHLGGLDALVHGLLNHRVPIERTELSDSDRNGLLLMRRETRQDHGDEDHDPHQYRAE
ncbi:MAG: hypothetical protein AUI15_33420 [Actinobacteria bacterium 13_2_20CM_2_66_6]|nr:MAG: hypothetical protein AUI15_33420 [Actinobacteria bacterium 13_2_20CM_2_66_6]